MKRLFYLFLMFAVIVTAPVATFAREYVVVIDPGHGGSKPGCVDGKTLEKDIVLKISKLLNKKIKNGCSNVKVLMTRQTDVDVDLYKRTQMARNNHADLFISIHINAVEPTASDYKTRKGCEVYILGTKGSDENLGVIAKENADALREKGTRNHYRPLTPEEVLANSLIQNTCYLKSTTFAQNVLKQMKLVAGRRNRGVREGNLHVLRQINCPAVLIELDYITTQADYLKSAAGQEQMADAIYKAFKSYYAAQLKEAKAAKK